MNLNETKKNLITGIKKELKKSKLEVLTNENDFLVKNLKKAGWCLELKNIYYNKFSKITTRKNNNSLEQLPKILFVKYEISIKNTN